MRSAPDPRIQALIECLARDFQETAGSTGLAAPDARLVAALRRVPRERFVPPDSRAYAWENSALAIGHGQTISQPFIVALMTQLLELAPGARVLEVGTGSGYQAAVLAELAAEVYSIEVVPELAAEAAERLRALGYRRVHVRAGDGRAGWPEAAPFDAVTVTAGGEAIPAALVQQLKPGGRLVMPVARSGYGQELVVGVREPGGGLATRGVLAVAFVPLV